MNYPICGNNTTKSNNCEHKSTSLESAAREILTTAWIATQLGPMLVIANEESLFLLEFADRNGLERQIERLSRKLKALIIPGRTRIIDLIESELSQYFAGTLRHFTTPLYLLGSDFQKSVWRELQKIPPGATWSYLALAKSIAKPTAFRAVANANGANQLAIIIPCHRVINADGRLGGYAGGVMRKQWLIAHEQQQ